jgi:hypothetical protein
MVDVFACAVWFFIEPAFEELRAKLWAKKERRPPSKGRRSNPKKRD